jgi:hypothetical protein
MTLGILFVTTTILLTPVFAAQEIESRDTENSVKTWFSHAIYSLTITDIKTYPRGNETLITWIANDMATGQVYYSTSSPVIIASSTTSVNISRYGNYANSKANIRSLAPNTKYYYKIYLQNGLGTAVSQENSFITTDDVGISL